MIKDDRDFSALGIAAKRVNKLSQEGIIVPTEVQEKVIPDIISNKNLIVQSPTGTGKTLAYLLPLLERIDQSTKDLEVLVLVPSRELAFQVVRVIQKFADDLGVVALTGGANGVRQLEGLKEKPKIVVGTPGRVLGSFNKKKLNGQVIKTIVVDEVDKMLSAGFMGDVFSIFQKTLKSRQVLMFSATIPKNLLNEASEIIDQPISIM
ncbi:MAG: DEAD/DEAH box helicase, partial [Clostridia bacterium]|nr:DEAD/DEAH box helicase [Clostridia bacterium]